MTLHTFVFRPDIFIGFSALKIKKLLQKVSNSITVRSSGLFLIERDFHSLLGNVRRDKTGRIVSASAAEFKLIGLMNGTAARLQDIHIDNALGEYVITHHIALAVENSFESLQLLKKHFLASLLIKL